MESPSSLSAVVAQVQKEKPSDSSLFLPELSEFLTVAKQKYDACIAQIDDSLTFEGIEATLRFHYVRFDNARPKFQDLAAVLAEHLVYYCITAQRRKKAVTVDEQIALFHEASSLLRRAASSGEPGEILLYFLLEAVLGAPQIVCKMSLKTNRNDEIKGSDGIHVSWDRKSERLTVYFGESKLYKDVSAALDSAFTSMESFHSESAHEQEIFIASNHFNLISEEVRNKICDLMDKRTPGTYDICHACFIGTDWGHYSKLALPEQRRTFVQQFEAEYAKRAKSLHRLFSERLGRFSQRHLKFEFFYIPFESVEQFRNWFFDHLPPVMSKR